MNFPYITFNKIKIKAKRILSLIFLRLPSDKEISLLYQKLLGRIPDKNEVIHWQVTRVNINVIKQVLISSYEYQQRLISEQIVLVNLQLFKIYAMISDIDIGHCIIQSKNYEPHVTLVLSKILGSGDVFLDVGANIGYFSLLASSIVGGSGKVIAFEPNTQNLQLFYSSILENQFSNIYIYPFAVSDANQIQQITSFGSNGFLETPESRKINRQFTQSVILDKMLQSEDKINVIKMDIEGYEPLALNGMNEIIRKHRPIVLTEFSPWHIEHRSQFKPYEYLQIILNHGYCLSVIEQSGSALLMTSIESLMLYWESLNNDKQHLDLMAQPLEKNTSMEEFKYSFKSINESIIPFKIDENLSIYQTAIGDYYLPKSIHTDIVINAMREGKIFETEIIEIARQYISLGSVVLDIGANFGQMTLIFAELVGEEGSVFSFEADDFVFSILEKNIAVSKCQNINPVCKAVYDKDGQTMFFPTPDFKRFGSYGSYGLAPNALSGRKVETLTIDSLNIQTPISFMKVDVQGSDLFVLKGATETIKRYQMPIIFEYEEQFNDDFHTSLDDYLRFIESIDYKIEKIILDINYLIVPKSRKESNYG
jgi:FkbM family methyltransferase